MPKALELTGQRFKKLTVIKRINNKKGFTMWLCKCECGNHIEVRGSDLKSGHTKSCGCYKKEQDKINLERKTHGLTKHRLHNIWSTMKIRCNCPNCKNYKNYGAKGITICKEWENDFMNFYNWATNNGYSDDLTIDRIDVNGNYEPNNCRWTTQEIQQNNRTNNRYLTYKGKTQTLAQWAKEININYKTFHYRISKYGNNFKKIFELNNIVVKQEEIEDENE